MRKILSCLGVLAGLINFCLGQNFGNEWFEVGKPYIKLTVNAGYGIYRVNFSQISDLIDKNLDPTTLKLYFRGVQVPILVAGEDDGVFSGSDHIEFYGIVNDAKLDSSLYEKSHDHTNPLAVIYDNKTYFFLSWGDDKGLRMPLIKPVVEAPPAEFVWGESLVVLDEEMSAGQEFAGQFGRWVTYSHFFTNKGRTGRALTNNASRVFTFNFPGYMATAQANPKLEIMAVSKRPGVSSFSLSIANNAIGSASFSTFTNYIHRQDIGKSFFTAPNLQISLTNSSLSVNTPISISYLRLLYPRSLTDLNQPRQFFYTQPSGNHTSFDFLSNRSTLRFFDVSNPYSVSQLQTTYRSGKFNFSLKNDVQHKIVVVNDVLSVSALEKIEFKTLQTDANYLIVTESRLRRPFQTIGDVVQLYADYRSSQAGGGFRVSVVNVDELYNYFSYGEAHPLALRRYVAYQLSNGNPEYLFIIGQGLKASLGYEKSKPASLNWATQNYVPGYGFPESDVLLTAGILPNSSPFEPALATGRLPVQKIEQIFDYLQKVIQHDTTSYIEGGKANILHLAGGNNAFEIGTISNFLKTAASTAEGIYVGANVETITKNTTEAIQAVNITPQVNRGIALMDFYGHGSLTSTQLDFGRPNSPERKYNNEGKYFGLTLWGCAGGDVFDSNFGILSDWVLAKGKGAILGYAHSSTGFMVDLGRMHNHLYESYFKDSAAYRLPFGKFLKNWTSHFYQTDATVLGRASIQQFVLVGDPAVRLFTNSGVDYDISNAKVRFISSNKIPITAQIDSFQVELPIRNNANYDSKNLSVLVVRKYADGSTRIYPKIDVTPFVKEKKITIKISQSLREKERAAGINYFTFTVDPDTLIPELREDNNTFTTTLVMPKGSINSVSPLDFSIVTTDKVTLYAVDNDTKGSEKNYLFQVDTTDAFDSPLLKSYTVNAYYKINKEINLDFADSTVVYWRVRPQDGSELDWETRSFTYIKAGQAGWSQSHFPQFKSIERIGAILRNDNARNWRFFSRDVNMEVRSLGFRHADSMGYYVKIDGITYFEAEAGERCAEDAFAFAAINPQTFKPYSPFRNHWFWNNLFCGNTSDFSYFHNDYLLGNWGGQINNYIFKQYYDRYQAGDLVIALSTLNYFHADAPQNRYLRDLALMGIDEAEYLQKAKRGFPFIAFSTKGNPQSKAQVFYPDPNSPIPPISQELKATFKLATLVDTAGSLVSPPIGPATLWKRLYFEFDGNDSREDALKVEVWGLNNQATPVLIVANAESGMALDSVVNPEDFAYIYLVAHLRDSKSKTPLQLKYWKVVFEEFPEAILSDQRNKNRNQTVMQGQDAIFNFKLKNTSTVSFRDSIVVEHVLEEVNSGKSKKIIQKLPALAGGDSVNFSFKANAAFDFKGEILVQTFANPFLQPELTFINNILDNRYWVNSDSLNPMLEVAFDGQYIADGDWVAQKPQIQIALWDENEFLVYSDTSFLEVYLSPCAGCEPTLFPFNGSKTELFKPNGLKVVLSPEFTQEGIYQLVVVGYDLSLNKLSYRVSFRVDFEDEVSHFYAYPNPFSQRIYFDFVLKGKKAPESAIIEIFDVVGHKIASLDINQVADLRVGRNEKVAVWDGRNQSGLLAAPGLYFYRVKFGSEGSPYRSTPLWPLENQKSNNGKVILQR